MEFIRTFKEDRKAVIVLTQAEKRNALSPSLVKGLKDAFDGYSNDPAVRVIVLRAEGPTFCAGADLAYLRELQQYGYAENFADSGTLRDLYYQIYTCPKPVIAQVQGHAIAGGCGLITVCDFVFAVPEAKFGYTEVRIGFIPAIVMSFLVRRIGEGHARRLLLGGELITAREACEIGMISRIVPADKLQSEVDNFASKIAKDNSGEAMAATKRMLAEVQSMTLVDALSHGVEMNAKARATADCRRGIDAFLRKENLSW
ncbi:MAG TPA: enoyl-CoA hydratase-related protein [Chryseolinea sp.]|nr:enoyl-CoA hydratase-related protein [Chryseolinea sp.]